MMHGLTHRSIHRSMHRPAYGRIGDTSIYFDSAAPGGGTGSYARPYNSLTPIAGLPADLKGRKLRFKRGSTFYAALNITNKQNFKIDAYGDSGTLPLFDLTTSVAGSWGTVWHSGTNIDIYRMADTGSPSYGTTVTGSNPYINGIACHERGSVADMQDEAMYYYSAQINGTWYYTYCHTGGYVYVSVPKGVTITSTRRSALSGEISADSAIYLEGITNASISDIRGRAARESCISVFGFNGLTLSNIWGTDPGHSRVVGTYANDCFNIKGASTGSRGLGLRMSNWYAYGAMTNAGPGNGIEISFLSDWQITGGSIADCRGNAFEFWQSSDAGTIERNKFYNGNSSQVTFLAGDGAGCVYSDILIRNNLMFSRSNYRNKGASGGGTPTGGQGIVTANWQADPANTWEVCTNVRVVNNTMHFDDCTPLYEYLASASTIGAGDNTIRFKNNLIILRQTIDNTGYAAQEPHMMISSLYASEDMVIDHNTYWRGRDVGYFQIGDGAGVDETIAALAASWNGVTDANHAGNDANSKLIAASVPLILNNAHNIIDCDLRPHSMVLKAGASNANALGADSADQDWPSTDFNGTTKVTGANAVVGALEIPAYRYYNEFQSGQDGNDDGYNSYEAGVSDTWNSVSTLASVGINGAIQYRYGITVPNVAIAQGTVITKAFLKIGFATMSGSVPTVDILAEQPRTTTQWTSEAGGHSPRTCTRLATKVTASLLSGYNYIDITAVVNAVLAHASWVSGDRLNLIMEAASGSNVISTTVRTINNATANNRPAVLII